MGDNQSVTCPNCGAVLPVGLEACSHCGALLAQPEALDVEPGSLLPAEPVLLPAPVATAEPPAPPPVLPDGFRASYHTTTDSSLGVKRVTSTKVNLKIPQEAVDKQRWLTPEQWDRLLDTYEAAMAEHMRVDLQAGQPLSLAAESGATPTAWDQVGDALTPEQRSEIEQSLRRLLSATAQSSTLPPVIAPPATMKVKGSATCGVVVFMLGLMAAGATVYFLAR